MAGLSWLRTGTITVSNGSRNVGGTDTIWGGGVVNPGDIILLPNGTLGEVESIGSNTALTLKQAYTGATASAQPYAIIRMLPSGNVAADLAAGVQALIQRAGATFDQLFELLDSYGVVSFSDGTTTLSGLHGLRKLMADIALRVSMDSAGRVGLGISPAFQFQIGKSSLDIAPGANPLVVLTNPAYAADTGVTLGFGFTPDSIGVALTGRSLASAGGGEFEVATRSSAGALAARCRFGASGLDVFGVMAADGFRHRSYTRATVPSASAYARCTIYVSDAVGGASPAWSDGAAWTSFKTNAAI